MRAIKFKESDYYSVEMQRGIYLIDGKVVTIDKYNSNVQVIDVNNIRPITRTNIVDSYTSDGKDSLSVDTYLSQSILLSKEKLVDEDGDVEWTSLESEFAYRKFISKWKRIYRNIESIGDVYSIEFVESVIETGNEFISSDYINGGKDPLLFIYSRPSAVLSIVTKKFKSLGMEFAGNISYSETAHKKKWGNATHSGIRYVTAFNGYVFNDSWNVKFLPKGDLSVLIAKYESDKKHIEEIIELKYFEHFGVVDENCFNFKELLVKLRSSSVSLSNVEPKQKTYSAYNNSKNKLGEAIRQIEESFK